MDKYFSGHFNSLKWGIAIGTYAGEYSFLIAKNTSTVSVLLSLKQNYCQVNMRFEMYNVYSAEHVTWHRHFQTW